MTDDFLEQRRAAFEARNLTIHKHWSDSFTDDVARFMLTAGQWPQKVGDRPDPEAVDLAEKLIMEEFSKEFMPAWNTWIANPSLENMVKMVDGALDSVYVLLWTLEKFGVPVNACWGAIQRANMSKFPGGIVTKNEFGKVVKPEGWTGPEQEIFEALKEASTKEDYVNGIATHR